MSKAKTAQYLIALLGAALGYFMATWAYSVNQLTHAMPWSLFVGLTVVGFGYTFNLTGRMIAYDIDPSAFDELVEES
jgi:hypothetical protein